LAAAAAAVVAFVVIIIVVHSHSRSCAVVGWWGNGLGGDNGLWLVVGGWVTHGSAMTKSVIIDHRLSHHRKSIENSLKTNKIVVKVVVKNINIKPTKPWPKPRALAFPKPRPGQKPTQAKVLAWPGLAQLFLARLGLAFGFRPEPANHYGP
jgi:hypothetical protein